MKYTCLLLILFCVFSSCKHYVKNASHQQISDNSIAAGEKLSKQYCGSCHMLPDPSLLNSKSWQDGVLPEMGPRLGIFFYGNKEYPSYKRDMFADKNYYPPQPVLSFAEWQHIIDYYTSVSPDSLLPAKRPVPVTINNNLFSATSTSFTYYMPTASYVKIDHDKLMMCDAFGKKLYLFNKQLQVTDSLNTVGSVTQVLEDSSAYILCNTGILSPNNGKFGSIVRVSLSKNVKDSFLFRNLMRPVSILPADLNKDGKTDLLVCEFGNLEGALSWLEKKDTGYVRHIIRAAPGAIKAYVDDYNHDGLPDIWALFAQGDESIYLFTNKGDGTFTPQRILRFPPVYGSSDFELDDMNNDGYPDIIYTCGDNADFSPVLKPYHGVYIFLNDGKNNFTQKYFYPINGCYKAVAKDFDGDGDLDIATISFFADYKNHPEEGFVYLKNNGNFNFTPYTMDAVKYGRWLTMDVGDFDGDGKPDIMLGNFSLMDPIFKAGVDWKHQPPFLLLKNIQK
jgi:hypothetical protein